MPRSSYDRYNLHQYVSSPPSRLGRFFSRLGVKWLGAL